MNEGAAQRIVLIVHYFPPINSSGAKRMEAMAKYFARAGRQVTVLTPTKHAADGDFSEAVPDGIELIELDNWGRSRPSITTAASHAPSTRSGGQSFIRLVKNVVMRWCGQLPDPRLPFAFGLLSPALDTRVRQALGAADVVVATCPPWAILLAGIFAQKRFGCPIVLDYRDQFSYCHEMPGSRPAKLLEALVDRQLTRRAASLVTISEPMAEYYRSFHDDVSVILNGYDPERVEAARAAAPWSPRPDRRPLTIRYLGIVTAGRIPRRLLGALALLRGQGKADPTTIRFEFYGDCQILEQTIAREYPGVADLFHFLPKVPYACSLELAASSDHLLFCENAIPPVQGQQSSASGILTTKLFEYLASGRPVIADISPATLAGAMIKRAGDHHLVADTIEEFAQFLSSNRFWTPGPSIDVPFVQSLSRASQANQYLAKLDEVSANRAKSL